MENIKEFDTYCYTPASVLNIINNCISIQEEKKIIRIEGIYISSNSKEYSGYFYDKIKDLNTNTYLGLMIPKSMKEYIIENHVYVFEGYINRKVQSSGIIQINFCVTKKLEEKEDMHQEEIKLINSFRKEKLMKNYKSFKLHIENMLLGGYKPRLALIIGNNAVIEDDILNMLGENGKYFDINTIRINLSSKEEIISKIISLDKSDNYDALIITRGGGSGLEIFNDIEIIERFSELNCILVTAIGHASDFCYIENIADCTFDTPTALGNYLRNVSDKVFNLYKKFDEEKSLLEKEIKHLKDIENKLNNQIKEKDINICELMLKVKSNQRMAYVFTAFSIVLLILYILKVFQ